MTDEIPTVQHSVAPEVTVPESVPERDEPTDDTAVSITVESLGGPSYTYHLNPGESLELGTDTPVHIDANVRESEQ